MQPVDSRRTADKGLSSAEKTPWSVSELTARLKMLIESAFPQVAVTGEISNLRRAASGHTYFTLKDAAAQIGAVMWRSRSSRLRFELQDGQEVIALGRVEVYPPHGKYQLVVDRLLPQGTGALEMALRQLREKLAAEGLFDEEHKKPLPRFPRRVALITSPTGAAVRDLLQVMTRRWPVDVVLLPVAVQGEEAAPQIAAALSAVAEIPGVEVVVVGRGGGSLEDLWAFNEEIVVRAIFDCPLPVVSAVGHEIDVSLSDLVADCRALTPSEAAERVVPDRREIERTLRHLHTRLVSGLQRRTEQARLRLEHLASRRLFTQPLSLIHDRLTALDDRTDRLRQAMHLMVDNRRRQLNTLAAAAEALSPLKVLQRGYSVTLNEAGQVVRSVKEMTPGQRLQTRLTDGTILSDVVSIDTVPFLPHSAGETDDSATS